MNVTDEMVERAARVFYDSQTDTHGRLATSGYADKWRAMARRALTAALGSVPAPEDDETEAIEFLNSLNAEGRIEYDDYSALHDLITGFRRGPVPADPAPPVYLALDLWQALGAPVGEFDAAARSDVPQLVAALEGVLAIHGRHKTWESDRAYVVVCGTCGRDYPCPTVRKIEEALNV